jgi:AAA+ superfamily predicted ATPase
MIYDLYDAEGVIRDHCIIEGSLEEAAVTEKNTAFLYHVRYEDLVYGTSELQLSMNSKNLSTIAKRETIYIFDMTSEQYEKFQTLDLFQAVFLHKIEIGALEPSEKLAWLRDEAANYGLAISKDLIKQEELLKMPLDYLTGLLVSAMGRLITENLPRKELTAADFMPEKNKQKKEADPYKELESLVGLGAVKDQIREIVCFVKNRGREILPCLHMVFCGNPGTGKTTVARLIGRIFAKEGIIKKKNVFVEASREDLVGLYVGHTAQKTAEKITDAMGGLLFIDEAYSLGLYDKGHDFGDEALSTLVKQMEDRRKDFVCIMAGYTEEMNKMLDVNPGLRDRIQFFIDFPDYNGEELLEIFSGFCKERKYKLLRKAKEALGNYLEEIVKRKGKNFANARLVRKICERIMMKQALRTTDNRITAADIEAIFAEKDMKALVEGNGQKKKIGFSGQ